jgi:hypothetical protein
MAGSIESGEHETICIIVSHEFRTRRSGCHDFTELRAYLDKPNMRQNDKACDFGAVPRRWQGGPEARPAHMGANARAATRRSERLPPMGCGRAFGPPPPWRGGGALLARAAIVLGAIRANSRQDNSACGLRPAASDSRPHTRASHPLKRPQPPSRRPSRPLNAPKCRAKTMAHRARTPKDGRRASASLRLGIAF